MAITTGAIIVEKGTQATVISDAVSIINGAFNAGTVTALVPTDKVAKGDAILDIQYSVAPDGDVKLYRRNLNIDGTNDASQPDVSFEHTIVGVFPLDPVTTRQYIPLTDIEIVGDQEFYIKNAGGQSTTGTTIVKVTPKTNNIK